MCDKELLVGYLYDEAEPSERRVLESHLRSCADCRGELSALRSVRTQLRSWAPPQPDLAFRVVRGATQVPRSRWAGLSPAWGLAAAAVLVLAGASAIANLEVRYGSDGLVIRTGWVEDGRSAGSSTTASATPASASVPPRIEPARTSLDDTLDVLSRRVQALEAAAARHPADPPVVSAAATVPTGDLLRRMRQIVSESENRQQQELALRITQVLRDVDGRSRQDAELLQRSLARVQGLTDTAIIRQKAMEEHVFRVAVQQK